MAIATSSVFRNSEDYYKDYPPNSLLASRMRAFLDIVIRSVKPQLVLEIGTYRAGTTEVIARALWGTGSGRLVTIDPYGIENGVPDQLRCWPSELPGIVDFYPQMSMQFFAETAKKYGQKFDVIFIDGNHEYEFALHDIVMSARFLRPGGLMVLDNAEHPGVLWAARHFLSLNPDWTEISGALNRYRADDPFRLVDSPINSLVTEHEGWMGFALISPRSQIVGERPVSFESDLGGVRGISGMRIDLSEATTRGILHLKAYLRTFPQGAAGETFLPEELIGTSSQMCDAGQTEVTVRLAKPLQSKAGSDASIRRCEVLLSWHPEDGGTTKRELFKLIPVPTGSAHKISTLKLAGDPLPLQIDPPI